MNPWFETFGVTLLAGVGAGIGWWFSRQRSPWWLLGYFLPLALILTIALARRYPALAFVPPVSWMMSGRTPFALIALVATMVLTTPLSRLAARRDRLAVVVMMVAAVAYASIWPFAAPAFNQKQLRSLQTRIDEDGICRQTTSYTCGPAAAVTALRMLGLPAEEGELALLAHTSEAMGTPPDILATTLRERYGRDGLWADYRHFQSADELRQAGLTLVVVKFGLLVDHYLVVLEMTEDDVVIGDPFRGKSRLSHSQFTRQWRYAGVVLKRAEPKR